MRSSDLRNNIILNFSDLVIYLYENRAPNNLNLADIADYLKGYGFSVEIRGDFAEHFGLKNRAFAERLTEIRIKNWRKKGVLNPNLSSEEVCEELRIMNSDKPLDLETAYEGFEFSHLLKKHVESDLHIVFTSRLLLSWSDRYHGRTIVINPPVAVVSTTGIVEAPAKPREYYSRLMSYLRTSQLDLPVPLPSIEEFTRDLKREFKGAFIDYNDERLTEVAKGFAMQCIVYALTGEAFCNDPDCRLYNAHTQQELLRSQLSTKEFCDEHKEMLNYIRERNLHKASRESCRPSNCLTKRTGYQNLSKNPINN